MEQEVVRLEQVGEGELGGGVVEAERGEPVAVALRPGPAGLRVVALAPEQELGETVALAHQVDAYVLADSHEIAQPLLRGRRYAHGRQLPGREQAGEAERVAAVGLDPVAGPAGDVAGGAHAQVEAALGGGAGEAVAGRAGLVDGDEGCGDRFQPGEHLVRAAGDAARGHLARAGIEHDSGRLLGVDVEAHRADTGHGRRLPSVDAVTAGGVSLQPHQSA